MREHYGYDTKDAGRVMRMWGFTAAKLRRLHKGRADECYIGMHVGSSALFCLPPRSITKILLNDRP